MAVIGSRRALGARDLHRRGARVTDGARANRRRDRVGQLGLGIHRMARLGQPQPAPRFRRSRGSPRPLAAEVVVARALLAAVAVEILVTYTRTPSRELYYVSGSGFGLAVHEVLLFVGFPTGLVANRGCGCDG